LKILLLKLHCCFRGSVPEENLWRL